MTTDESEGYTRRPFEGFQDSAPEKAELLSDEEVRKVILALLNGRRTSNPEDPTVSRVEIATAVRWAESTRLNATALKMVLDDQLLLNFIDGEMVWGIF